MGHTSHIADMPYSIKNQMLSRVEITQPAVKVTRPIYSTRLGLESQRALEPVLSTRISTMHDTME